MSSKFFIISLLLSYNIIFAQIEWTQLNSGTNSYLRDLHFINENIGWVVGHNGLILKTTDGGNVWNEQSSGTSVDLTNVSFISDQNGWVGGQNSTLLKTTDGGNNWEISQLGFSGEDIYGLVFIDENIGHAVIGKLVPYYYGYVIKTSNGGSSWQLRDNIFDDAFLDIYAKASYGWAVGTGVAAYTTNTGNSWNFVSPSTQQWLYDVYFLDDATGWAVGGGTDSEIILKTANGGISWQVLREYYQYQRLQGVYFINTDVGWTVGQNGVILLSTNGGDTWEEQSSPVSTYLREVQFPTDGVGYAIGENGVILKYSEFSNLINIITPNGGEVIIAGTDYYIEWNSQNVIDVKIEYSTDSGINWYSVIDSIPSTGIHLWNVPNVIIDEGRIRITDISDSTIYDVSATDFTIQSSKTISVVDPNGGEIIEGGTQYEILWNSNDVENVKIEYTINNGASWNTVTDSMQSTGVFLWNVPNLLTIQARIKISDVEMPSIYDISDETFRIEHTVNVDDNNLLNSYNLEQNYPNPFNPTTTINYQISELSFVTLKIYDALGNELVTLFSEEKPAGNYEIKFNAANIPSGIYFYTLTAGNFIQTKKLILLK